MIRQIPGQMSLTTITTPPWVKCFKTCRHFDSHPEWPPDRFPGDPKQKRCTYHMKGYGTSGGEFWQERDSAGIVEMYCRQYEGRQNEL